MHLAGEERVVVRLSDGTEEVLPHHRLGPELSREIFVRSGKVARVDVFVNPDRTVRRHAAAPIDTVSPAAGGDAP
jgi:hypothetical protein